MLIQYMRILYYYFYRIQLQVYFQFNYLRYSIIYFKSLFQLEIIIKRYYLYFNLEFLSQYPCSFNCMEIKMLLEISMKFNLNLFIDNSINFNFLINQDWADLNFVHDHFLKFHHNFNYYFLIMYPSFFDLMYI